MLRLPIAADETARLVSLSATGLFGISKDYVFECITNIGAQLFNVPVCSLVLADAEKNWFNSHAIPDVREIFRNVEFLDGVLVNREPMIIEDTFLDVRSAGDRLLRIAPQIRFYAGHPIRDSSGTVLGTLCVLDLTPRDFPPEQQNLLRELVFLTELSLINRGITTAQKALVAKLDLARHESLIDPLLRIWNRGGITTILNRQQESSRELRGNFSILMADIDHFKLINDHHGHISGDTTLKAVTGVLQATLRADDELGRYGGEEFIAILPNTNAANAEELAHRLKESVAALSVSTPTGSVGCTVSIGVAEWVPTRLESVQALVHRADAALLTAKQCGRNCVRVSPRASSGG